MTLSGILRFDRFLSFKPSYNLLSITTLRFCIPLPHILGCKAFRFSSSATCIEKSLDDFKVIHLENKTVLKLSGGDVYSFLQGLITNDISLLGSTSPSMYSMMLNIKGRVLCDLMFYRDSEESNSVLMEVDSSQSDMLQNLFKKYKLRRNVVIEEVTDQKLVLAAFGCVKEMPKVENGMVFRDPRLSDLGWRLILQKQVLTSLKLSSIDVYNGHRYGLGVGEGPQEHIPDKSLPLECNLVLLNGVSFSKGCYIGQELTARSHHTGVIRKRIVPISTEKPCEVNPYSDVKLKASDKSVGSLRGFVDNKGIALLRLSHLLKSDELYITDTNGYKIDVIAYTPTWWPTDLIIE